METLTRNGLKNNSVFLWSEKSLKLSNIQFQTAMGTIWIPVFIKRIQSRSFCDTVYHVPEGKHGYFQCILQFRKKSKITNTNKYQITSIEECYQISKKWKKTGYDRSNARLKCYLKCFYLNVIS